MCTHREPSRLLPSPRTRNSGNAVRKKRVIPSMSRTLRLACSSRTAIAHLRCGLTPVYADPDKTSPGRPKQPFPLPCPAIAPKPIRCSAARGRQNSSGASASSALAGSRLARPVLWLVALLIKPQEARRVVVEDVAFLRFGEEVG